MLIVYFELTYLLNYDPTDNQYILYTNHSTTNRKHKVFVSFHHADQQYRNKFDSLFGEHFVSMSVDYGDIEPANTDEHIKRLVQEDHIVHSSVVFALYGAETYKRKHVDWEISAALGKRVGGHKGLAILLLPSFPLAPYNVSGIYEERLIYPYLHPRVAANLNNGYANLYFWPGLFTNYAGVRLAPIPLDAPTGDIDPQTIQGRYPKFDELKTDLLAVNARLIKYREKMRALVLGLNH